MKVRLLTGAILVAASALFIDSFRVIGLAAIANGLARIGWWFVAILALSGARDVIRAQAWTLTVEAPHRLGFVQAFRARLAGEALNSLLPMGVLVGEPTKARQVGDTVPFAAALRGLAVEFAFYTGSLVPLFAAGIAAFAVAAPTGWPLTTASAVVATLALGGIATPRLVRQARASTARPVAGALAIAACEVGYQLLSIAETYVTLLLIDRYAATIAAALVLETVSRAVTIVFKIVPMRIGVDEASSSFVAGHVSLDPATGLMLALIRKLRLAVWSGVGLTLLVWRSARDAARARAAQPRVAAVVAAALVLVIARGASAQDAGAVVAGSVAITGPDGGALVVPGVTVTLRCADDAPRTAVTDDRGEFRFADLGARPAGCAIDAELQGFTAETSRVVPVAGETATATLQLKLDTLREEVTVRATPQSIEGDRAPVRAETVTAALMNLAPIANDRFQDALPLIPGVVRGPDGLLNINGSRSNQAALTFNSANATDPVTGEDAIELPIDAVSSVQVRGAAYAPEFGLSSGAVTQVETLKAGDAWDVTVNDLEPRLRRRDGAFRGIESWTPRATVGGPIVAGKVQLLESVQYEYSQTRVYGLPPLESDTKLQTFETFTRADWLATQNDQVTLSALASPRTTTYAGLNTFNPQSTTADVHNHNVLASVADQKIVSTGVIDIRASVKQFDATITPSQGTGPMVLAPDVNSGSYFNDQDRTSRRAEGFVTYSFTPLGAAHLIKVGGGLTYETFEGVNTSRPVRIVRADGTASQVIEFTGAGRLDQQKTAVRGFVQDAWNVGSRLSLVSGVRYDRESLAAGVNLAPRGSLSFVAGGDGRTVVRAGGGLFYAAEPLNVASFAQLQNRVITMLAADGTTPSSTTVLANVQAAPLRVPRSTTWNVELDREWFTRLFVRVGYQERDNHDDAIVDVATAAILLRNDGESRYREAQVTARYTFHGDDRIVASYTRSLATGNLNDYNTFFGNLEDPVIRPDERGPLAWDAPHRLLVWGSVTLPHGFAVFPVVETRSGFPLSNVDADRNFVGDRNAAGRFPTFFSLDAQVTKKLRIIGHNATIGLKVFDITNHFNPRDYQGNVASSFFGGFANGVGRTFRGKWVFEW
jgi:hypothetical protein